jgi:hypothetical protein
MASFLARCPAVIYDDCRKRTLLQYSDLAGAINNRQFVGEAFFLSDRDYAPIIFFLSSVQQLDRCFTLHLIVTTRTLGQTSAVRVRIITFFRDGGTTLVGADERERDYFRIAVLPLAKTSVSSLVKYSFSRWMIVPLSSSSVEQDTAFTDCHVARCRSSPAPKIPFNIPLTASKPM